MYISNANINSGKNDSVAEHYNSIYLKKADLYVTSEEKTEGCSWKAKLILLIYWTGDSGSQHMLHQTQNICVGFFSMYYFSTPLKLLYQCCCSHALVRGTEVWNHWWDLSRDAWEVFVQRIKSRYPNSCLCVWTTKRRTRGKFILVSAYCVISADGFTESYFKGCVFCKDGVYILL